MTLTPASFIRRKATKAVVAHSAHGALSKARRKPARSVTLIGAGAIVGLVTGFVAGRRRAPGLGPMSPAPAEGQAGHPDPVAPPTAPGPAPGPVTVAGG